MIPLRSRFARFLLVLVLVPAAGGCRRHAASSQGDPGGSPRVITTTPSATEIVAALGMADHLVGRDRYSVYPPEVKKLPVVGDFLLPSTDAILELDPDLVVLDQVQARSAEALAKGGVHTLVLDVQSIEDVLDGVTRAGKALGRPEAARALRARIEHGIAQVKARGAARAKRPRVLLVVDRELGGLRSIVAAGPGSYLDELCRDVGGENVLGQAGVRYPKVAPDTIEQMAPDVIVDATHAGDPVAAARDWSPLEGVPAVTHHRVYMLTQPYFVSPGPRVDQALAELERLLFVP